MARKKLESKSETVAESTNINEDSLKEIVESYISNKKEADKYSKLAKSENDQIKKSFAELKITSCDTDAGTVKLSVSKSESFREDDLIALLKKKKLDKNIVVMKEVIDFDALESAIYHEIIDTETLKEMDRCKEVKLTEKLLISKKKGE